jgi:hypothetical protein
MLDCQRSLIATPRRGRWAQARAADRRRDPGGAEAITVRWSEAGSATMCAISDAVRWAEEILQQIDRRWPVN